MDDAAIAALLSDYIGLYAQATLPRWRELFGPGFTATAANADGSITTYALETFYARQQTMFATGKPIREVLDQTQVHRAGRLACIESDFVWTDGEQSRRGRLMMLLVAEHDRPRIQALTFGYYD